MKINMSYEIAKDKKSDILPPTPVENSTKVMRRASTRRIPTKKSISPLSQGLPPKNNIDGILPQESLISSLLPTDIPNPIPSKSEVDSILHFPTSPLPEDIGSPKEIRNRPPSPRPSNKFTINNQSITQEELKKYLPPISSETINPILPGLKDLETLPPTESLSVQKIPISDKLNSEEIQSSLPSTLPEIQLEVKEVHPNIADIPVNPKEFEELDKYLQDISLRPSGKGNHPIEDIPEYTEDRPPPSSVTEPETPILQKYTEDPPTIVTEPDTPIPRKYTEDPPTIVTEPDTPIPRKYTEDRPSSSRITDITDHEPIKTIHQKEVSVSIPEPRKKKSITTSVKELEEHSNLIDVPDNLIQSKAKVNQVQEVVPEQSKRKRVPMKRKILLTIDANSVSGQLDLYERKYALMSAEKKKIALRNLRNKFKTLQINYTDFEFDIPETENPAFLHCCYDISVHQIDIQTNYTWWRDICIIVFLGIEFLGTWFLKLKLSGFAENQVRQMNRYKRSLIEIAERQSFGMGSSWPPEVRLIFLGLANSVIFCLMNTFLSYFTPEIRNGIQNFLNDLIAPETKDKDYPNGLNGPSIVEMFGRMLGYGGNQEKTPAPKKASRKPKHDS